MLKKIIILFLILLLLIIFGLFIINNRQDYNLNFNKAKYTDSGFTGEITASGYTIEQFFKKKDVFFYPDYKQIRGVNHMNIFEIFHKYLELIQLNDQSIEKARKQFVIFGYLGVFIMKEGLNDKYLLNPYLYYDIYKHFSVEKDILEFDIQDKYKQDREKFREFLLIYYNDLKNGKRDYNNPKVDMDFIISNLSVEEAFKYCEQYFGDVKGHNPTDVIEECKIKIIFYRATSDNGYCDKLNTYGFTTKSEDLIDYYSKMCNGFLRYYNM